MLEYQGKSAKTFRQTGTKRYLLIPALMRVIPVAKKNQNFLDVACGNGYFNEIAINKGYAYTGFDKSPDMLKRAIAENPDGTYIEAFSDKFSDLLEKKFDIILINMLFPVFSKKENIAKTLNECKKVLNDGGRIIIGVPHPHFDAYMKKGLFNFQNIETNFSGYFNSGEKIFIKKKFDNGEIVFEDYHWTLRDYLEIFLQNGLALKEIDECEPFTKDPEFLKRKSKFPTYLVFALQKK